MCDDRERLIGYVYDECEAAERQRIEAHLSGCPSCRQEIAGLRAVRQDLLAWDVPSHASVWRPAPPVRTVSWRDVPAWAMAAAAGLVLMAGAAGGAAAQVLLAQPAPEVAQTAAAPMPGRMAVAETPTAADVEALERRVMAIIRAEMDERANRGSGGSPANQERRASAQEVPEEKFVELLTVFHNQLVSVQRNVHGIEDKVDSVMALAQPQAVPVSMQGQ